MRSTNYNVYPLGLQNMQKIEFWLGIAAFDRLPVFTVYDFRVRP